MSFLLLFLLFPITQDLFLPNSYLKVLLDVCVRLQAGSQFITLYMQLAGSLQAGRSTLFLAVIETADYAVTYQDH